MIESLDLGADDDDDADDDSGDESGGRSKPRRCVTIESRLASLATVVKAASAASRESWEVFKDASGLSFAEAQAKEALKQSSAKDQRPAMVPSMIVEILPERREQ